MHTFFKMATFSFKKRMLGCNNPPHLPTLTAYPTPTLGGTPNFFHQNEQKRCKIDYLKALMGQFLFRFYAAVKTRGGYNNPPGLTRVKATIFQYMNIITILKVPVPKSLENEFSLKWQIWSFFLPKHLW